ncbi:DUF11 domain-containing protein [Candidatus Saccharibacteria bacterium]|nr:DUF11 domain-containing protein [Candidatus Saccharibacteria bacterium]
MKKAIKTTLGIAAAAAIVGANLAPVAVLAWGDNSKGGRESYTREQIEQGVLGDTIVFNSISNSVIGDEKNFVGAREDTGINAGAANVWNGNEITVEDGKTYLVRLYVHNNNPKDTDAIAENVTTSFNVSTETGTSVEVNGFIDSTNATPTAYWDNVVFKSSSEFYLDYVEGSALLENNGIGANGGVQLSDDIVTRKGVKIGYDALDGKIPGCYKYASYVTIKVKATFVKKSADYLVEKQVRMKGSKTWGESVDAKVGDTVEYRIHYKNTTDAETENVMVKDILPNNMEYVEGTTMLYNATNPSGIARDDVITTTGVNIGGYAKDGDGYIIFSARVVNKNLACGQNKLVNWGQVGVADKTIQDSADVLVNIACSNVTPQEELPSTGPASVLGAVIGFGSLTTAAGYYIASRKKLM